MKSNQKGFSAIEILIVIIAIVLLGLVIKWKHSIQNNKKDNTTISSTKRIDTTVHEVNISLQSEADLAKLPDYTPASFKSYMAEILRNNKTVDTDGYKITNTWNITKISQVNIKGGMVPRDQDGNGQTGGAPMIWVLTPTGTWEEETLNGAPCASKSGGKIYEEFATMCWDAAHPDGIKNPNGSIKSLAQ